MSTVFSLSLLVSTILLAPLCAQGPESFDRVTRVSAVERPGHHYASLTGRLLDPDNKPFVGARVILMGNQAFYRMLPLGESTTDAEGRFRIEGINGTGEPRLWVQTPKWQGYQFESRSVELIDGNEVDLGSWKPFELWGNPARTGTHVLSGVLLDGKGNPVPQAFLRMEEGGLDFDPGACSYTDAKGTFRIESRSPIEGWLSIFAGQRRFRILHRPGQKEMRSGKVGFGSRLSMNLGEDMKIQLDELLAIDLPKAGEGQATLEYRLHFGGRVEAYPGGHLWLAPARFGSSREILVSRAGHLPRPMKISLSTTGEVHAKSPDFGKRVSYKLQFDGLPAERLAQVKLDIGLVRGDREAYTTDLGRFDLDATGAVHLKGAADAVYQVHAYLPGHDPVEAWWLAGRTLHLRFVARDKQVVFRGAGKGSSIRVKLASSFAPVAISRVENKGMAHGRLTPGRYEASLYDAKNQLISTQGFEVTENSDKLDVNLGKDSRPRIRLLLPEPRKIEGTDNKTKAGKPKPWYVSARRGGIGGMVTGWMATYADRRLSFLEERVGVEKKSEREYELRFPTSGSYFLYSGREDMAGRFFLPVDLALGEDLEIHFPETGASLEGEMSSYKPSKLAQHGVAGPRFLLWPSRSRSHRFGLGLFVGFPDRGDDGSFEVAGLPVGDFFVFHHLIGKEVHYKDSKGQPSSYNEAVDVGGGLPVRLSAGLTTYIGDLDSEGAGTLDIRVTDEQGKPIPFGYLEVRDPMFDSWSKVVDGGSTLRMAQDPIPAPPRARIQLGKSRLEHIRKGRLLMRVLLPGGWRVTLERDVVSGQLLELHLPL